jgi:hypothetical protein
MSSEEPMWGVMCPRCELVVDEWALDFDDGVHPRAVDPVPAPVLARDAFSREPVDTTGLEEAYCSECGAWMDGEKWRVAPRVEVER